MFNEKVKARLERNRRRDNMFSPFINVHIKTPGCTSFLNFRTPLYAERGQGLEALIERLKHSKGVATIDISSVFDHPSNDYSWVSDKKTRENLEYLYHWKGGYNEKRYYELPLSDKDGHDIKKWLMSIALTQGNYKAISRQGVLEARHMNDDKDAVTRAQQKAPLLTMTFNQKAKDGSATCTIKECDPAAHERDAVIAEVLKDFNNMAKGETLRIEAVAFHPGNKRWTQDFKKPRLFEKRAEEKLERFLRRTVLIDQHYRL